ncbi:uncharacterized protein LOC108808191 [Raphanus sativus]|uniref:Uncharacterized protein LOC108808191 n=1 Tax=Raphanus sativus TaxID=3726 RepID=A0A6J0JLJ6_RAPSA|nr:uncharacterized protein LOC108808191 [Raphanus sativus]
MEEKEKKVLMIQSNDPLYGVLSEEQVGVDIATGRRKINPEVLQNMREYILAAEGGEKRVREERVRNSVMDLEKDLSGQKTFLRLEPPPLITSEIEKDRGLVFDYALKDKNDRLSDRDVVSAPVYGRNLISDSNHVVFDGSTGFSTGFTDASSSGTSKMRGGKHYRPPKKQRKFKPKVSEPDGVTGQLPHREEPVEKGFLKRRAEAVAGVFSRVARRSKSEVVPNGGLPNQ